ncbi:MAG TPA: hypothetical protein VFG10_03660 [Saprospiraceae bacterium]|nr:hypothetical protein [Saprospiraceae bacterium]
MRIPILIYSTFLLLLMNSGCAIKPGLKTNVQDQQTIQNSNGNPSNLVQTDLLASDSINQIPIGRKLLRRGEVWNLTTESGQMVISICVDQTGQVISAKYDHDKSTRNNAMLSRKAEQCAKQYVFEEDLTALPEQCGRLTFIFERK